MRMSHNRGMDQRGSFIYSVLQPHGRASVEIGVPLNMKKVSDHTEERLPSNNQGLTTPPSPPTHTLDITTQPRDHCFQLLGRAGDCRCMCVCGGVCEGVCEGGLPRSTCLISTDGFINNSTLMLREQLQRRRSCERSPEHRNTCAVNLPKRCTCSGGTVSQKSF